jgi:hypothetical protein
MDKEFNKLPISQKLKSSELLGSKVAKIMNKAMKDANKLLAEIGHGVNIQADFYKIEDQQTETPKSEIANG